jgi:hypothetical protein
MALCPVLVALLGIKKKKKNYGVVISGTFEWLMARCAALFNNALLVALLSD